MNDLNMGELFYVGTWGQRIQVLAIAAPPKNQATNGKTKVNPSGKTGLLDQNKFGKRRSFSGACMPPPYCL
jgi:hypothetical protein